MKENRLKEPKILSVTAGIPLKAGPLERGLTVLRAGFNCTQSGVQLYSSFHKSELPERPAEYKFLYCNNGRRSMN